MLSEIRSMSSVHWKAEMTIRKCIEVTSACDSNENVQHFGVASSTKLFLMEI